MNGYYVSMHVNNTTLSIVYHTSELEKMHHLIVVECACINEIVDGIANLAQKPENVVQMFA